MMHLGAGMAVSMPCQPIMLSIRFAVLGPMILMAILFQESGQNADSDG